MIQPGLVGEATLTVERAMLASAMGSGNLDVLATPALIALMENAACQAVEGHLADGQTTVGVSVEVRHLAPTPTGSVVRARAELVEVDRRRLVFQVEAFDEREKIGEGSHERAVVDAARLLARAAAKLGGAQ